jgi:hypothetical protein
MTPGSELDRLDALLERKGPLASAVAGALGLALAWLIHPIVPSPFEPGLDQGMEVLVAIAFVTQIAPVLLLEGLAALVRPAAPSPPPAPTRFAAFDESLRRDRQWQRTLGFCLVGAAHSVVYFFSL